LFGNQLAAGGFDSLYDPNLQQYPDSIDPNDVFSFNSAYLPVIDTVKWNKRVFWELDPIAMLDKDIAADAVSIPVISNGGIPATPFVVYMDKEILEVTGVAGDTWTVTRGQQGLTAEAHKKGAVVGMDRQFLDFNYGSSFAVYHWELFYHIPLYIAQLLSQNQQFDKAQKWFHYIFNPTRQGSDPVPQRFWITKPLHNLTSAKILEQQINRLLESVNKGDPTAKAEVMSWRKNPFNPFLLADLRNVAYMKSIVMSYLDNLIAWGDNLFSSESREALSEATLIYVVASEILGPTPIAVTPPKHADESFDKLEPKLDVFANAMVEIENVIAGSAEGVKETGLSGGIPGPHTFYFKIPSNAKLLGYWTTVADRLFKLRHCRNIAGAPLQLALFDAPIDPGLLIAAQAAGVDLSSALSDLGAPLPHYRFNSLYPQALDFVNAVRAYGSALQAALERTDASALALLQQTTQQQLLTDGSQILDWQVELAQNRIDNLDQSLVLAQQRCDYYSSKALANPAEASGMALHTAAASLKVIKAVAESVGAGVAVIPTATVGVAGVFGSPVATLSSGGGPAAKSAQMAGAVLGTLAEGSEPGWQIRSAVGRSARPTRIRLRPKRGFRSPRPKSRLRAPS
jgi:hypothetical protein